MPTGDDDLENQKEDLKETISELTETHKKQVSIHFLLSFVFSSYIKLLGKRNYR
jgi:hypothetical protein